MWGKLFHCYKCCNSYASYTIASIQSKNLKMMHAQAYHDMGPSTPCNICYLYLPADGSHLYCLFYKSHGIIVTIWLEQNLHHWLDPNGPYFQHSIYQSVFYHMAQTHQNEWLKVCISTSEIDEAAWKYTHRKQIFLNGTFGVCSSQMLLFIAMGIDEDGKDVPLALFLFSAPTGNRATHAGYNEEILQELLEKWKMHLSLKDSMAIFYPLVTITDTDTKEKGVLQDVWPCIWLLLHHFHLQQCWTDHHKRLLAVKNADFWKHHVLQRVWDREVQYIFKRHSHSAKNTLPDGSAQNHTFILIS